MRRPPWVDPPEPAALAAAKRTRRAVLAARRTAGLRIRHAAKLARADRDQPRRRDRR